VAPKDLVQHYDGGGGTRAWSGAVFDRRPQHHLGNWNGGQLHNLGTRTLNLRPALARVSRMGQRSLQLPAPLLACASVAVEESPLRSEPLNGRNRLLATVDFRTTRGRADTVEVRPAANAEFAGCPPWRSLPSDRLCEIREERQCELDRLHLETRLLAMAEI